MTTFTTTPAKPLRHLVIVLGDQLDANASALSDFDASQDMLWMAEVREESTHVPSSRQRTVLFLSAMRHFAHEQRALGRQVHYSALDDPDNTHTLASELLRTLAQVQPQQLVMTAPGDWRVLKALQAAAKQAGLTLVLRDDTHFITTVRDFAAHAKGRKQLRLEFFYREMRRQTGLLMEGDAPEGGQWNFDEDNRSAFPASGPTQVPEPTRFAPDAITQTVMAMVQRCLPDQPGRIDTFGWPVTRAQALEVLEAFIQERLPLFGQYQDAMWTQQPWLYHAHIASSLNLKLLSPLEVARAAEDAYRRGHAPLAAVEGFIRQVIGWREYVRGIYWLHMPDYLTHNALQAHERLPAFYWTGETEMACLRDAIAQTLDHGYAHHIQRLMVTGLYALLLGVEPQEVHAWYLSVYVDAVEWVEVPNTLGMSQFADGGLMASKPYVASGKYIDRMSNYCKGCRFNPAKSTGEDACPFTTLYWDFLARHHDLLAANPRMRMQLKNLARLSPEQQTAIAAQAASLRAAA
jgi:deoxyribodipyrimidine photolyase-related protein